VQNFERRNMRALAEFPSFQLEAVELGRRLREYDAARHFLARLVARERRRRPRRRAGRVVTSGVRGTTKAVQG